MQVKNIINFLNFQLIKDYEIDSIFWIETEYMIFETEIPQPETLQ